MERKITIEELWKQKFYDCLAIEFSIPAYFEVHHLLVITYMLQADGYSPAYFPEAVKLLEGFLYEEVSPKQLIKTDQSSAGGIENRQQRNLDRFDWETDILSIRTEDTTSYCQDVRNWAENVLRIIKRTNSKV